MKGKISIVTDEKQKKKEKSVKKIHKKNHRIIEIFL